MAPQMPRPPDLAGRLGHLDRHTHLHHATLFGVLYFDDHIVGYDLRVVYRLLVGAGAGVGHVRGLEKLFPLGDRPGLDYAGDDIEKLASCLLVDRTAAIPVPGVGHDVRYPHHGGRKIDEAAMYATDLNPFIVGAFKVAVEWTATGGSQLEGPWSQVLSSDLRSVE